MPTLQSVSHSTNAEESVLGAILLDPDAVHSVITLLQPSDFFDPTHRAIYSGICDLYASGTDIDIVTLSTHLEQAPELIRVGGSSFLAELASNVPTSSNIHQYADIVKCRSTRRDLVRLGKNIVGMAEDGEKTNTELIETVEQSVLDMQYAAVQHKSVSIGEMRHERYEHYAMVHEADDPTAYYGIQTGFQGLDDLMVGLRPGDLCIVAGRPSMGKTAIALEIARCVAEQQSKNVAFYSLEMNKEQLFNRLFAAWHGVDEHKLSRGELSDAQMEGMGTTFDQIASIPLFVDDDPDKSIANLRSKARRQKMEQGIDLLIIDYMQLIEVPSHVSRNNNRTEELRYISGNVKALAREIEAPIIALSQLNREADKRVDKRPQLSDLRESGAIEQDADYAVMLYREAYYDEDSDRPYETDLYLRKNRPHGKTGVVELHFDIERGRFAESKRG